MVRTNQGGSVLSFIIIGIILTGLLIGGVYVVRQQSAAPPAVQPQEPVDQPPQKPEEQRETSPPVSNVPAAPRDMPSSGPSALPQAGPVETAGTVIVLGLLSGVILSYLRSRRPGLSL